MALLYYVIGPSSGWGDPTVANIKAGQLAGGGAATASGSETARTTTGEQVFATPASGLTAGTSYKVAFVWSDGSNDSTVSVSDAFSTTAVQLSGAVVESATDTATGTITYQHTLTGAVTESGTDTATGAITFIHTLSGAVVEGGADTATGTILSGTDTYLSGAVVESGADTATGAISFAHTLTGAAVESATDTAAGTILGQATLSGSVVESTADHITGTLDNPEAVIEQTRGGAGKAKVKKKRPQKAVEVDTTITEVIRNLESDKKVDGVIQHTKKVVENVEPLEDDFKYLQELKKQLQEFSNKKPPDEFVDVKQEPVQPKPNIDFKPILSRLDSLDTKLNKVLKKFEELEEVVIALTNL